MPTVKQKHIIENFKFRIKKKYKDISEETENLSHLLQTCLLQFESRMLELLEKDDGNFCEQYRKLNQDLESYRGKLFHVQTVIEEIITKDTANELFVDTPDEVVDTSSQATEKNMLCQSISNEISDICGHTDLNVSYLAASNEIKVQKDPVVVDIISVTKDKDIIGCLQTSFDQEGSENSSSCYRSFSSNFSDICCDEMTSNYIEKDSKVFQVSIPKSDTENLLNSCSQKVSACKVPLPNITVPSNFSATLTHIIDPGNFWLQLENFNDHNFPVSDYVHQQPPLQIKHDAFCLARFKSTSFYYRAKTLTAGNLEEKVRVFFIDHGSTDDVPLCDLRPLPWSAYDIPIQAINCYLLGVLPTGDNWSIESVQRFKEFQCYSIKTLVKFKLCNKYGVKLITNVSEEFNEDYSTDIAQSLYLDNLAVQGNFGPFDGGVLKTLEQPISSMQHSKYVSHSGSSTFDGNVNKVSCDSGVSITSTDKSSHTYEENTSSLSCNSVHHSSLKLSASREAYESDSSKMNEFFNENNVKSESNDLISFESMENLDNLCSSRNEIKDCELIEKFQTSKTFHLNDDFSLHLIIPPPRISFVEQNMMLIMFSHIVSPSDFYVNMAMENSTNLDDLREQMTSTYELLIKTMPPININDIVENMFCATCFEDDGYWYRVKVLHASVEDKRKGEVLVQYLDWGNSAKVKLHNLYPLSSLHANYPAFAVKCCLAGCTPKKVQCENSQSIEDNWDEHAIRVFKELIRPEKCFTAQLFQEAHYEHQEALSVWLWDTEGSDDLLINSVLVTKGVADFDNASLRKFSLQETFKKYNEIDLLSKWDPMSDEYHSIENSYGVPIEDLEIATLGYKAKDEDYTCKYFALRGSCPQGSDCPYLHVPLMESGITRDQEEVYSFNHVISIPEGAKHILLEATSVITPGHFYAVFPFGTRDVNEIDSLVLRGSSYDELMNKEAKCLFHAMNKHYSEAPFDENTTVALPCGNIVAAKRKFDDKWHRGRIIDVHDIAGPAMVFFVDFGHKEWVSRKFIRKILPQFLHTPFQAVECALADVVPKDSEQGNSWSLEAINFFKECVSEELLLAEVKYRCGHVLNVTLRKTSKHDHAIISALLVTHGYAQFQKINESLVQENLFVPG